MNDWQRKVQDFHEKFDVPVGTEINLDERELRAKLILEEAAETVAAMGFDVETAFYPSYGHKQAGWERYIASFVNNADDPDGDIVEVADGLADLIYVVLGSAVSFGIDLDPIFAEVHRTNMLKVGGSKRGDGKVLKPEGWEPPRILSILADQDDAHLVHNEIAAHRREKGCTVPACGCTGEVAHA